MASLRKCFPRWMCASFCIPTSLIPCELSGPSERRFNQHRQADLPAPQLPRRGLTSDISRSALHAGDSTRRCRECGDFPNNSLAELAHTRDHPQAFAIDPTSLQLMVDPAMQSIWTSLTNTPFDPVQHFASTTSRFTPDIDGFPSIEVRECRCTNSLSTLLPD